MISNNLVLQKKAERGGYAIGAFNAANLGIIKAILDASAESKSDVIIECSVGAIKYAGAKFLAAMTYAGALDLGIKVSLHLDHGDSLERVKECISAGFTSVMIDYSELSFEDNVRETKKVVDYAHKYGVIVEGEIGHVGGAEDLEKSGDASFTDPEKAKEFVKLTGVDTLAVSIGNVHGFYKGEPNIDFALLKEIRKKVKVPLVLHGSSGINDKDIKKAIKLGVTKINVNTEIREAYTKQLKKTIKDHPDQIVIYKTLTEPNKAAHDVVAHRLKLYKAPKKRNANKK
jgi:fructose-bisphosphate aldolase class II